MSAQQAAIVISESEESKRMHGKHKYYMKPRREGATKYILVPAPKSDWKPTTSDITNAETQTRVDDPIEIFTFQESQKP